MRILMFLSILFLWGCGHNNDISAVTAPINYNPKDFTVKGKVNKLPGEKVFLYNFYGHKSNCIDSVIVEKDGSFTFKIKKETPPGLYRIIMGKTLRSQFMGGGDQYVDFIFKYEDINFETHFEFPFDSMKVITSDENRNYYAYLLETDAIKTKLDILLYCLQYYPRTDKFFKVVAKQYDKVYDDYEDLIDKIISQNKGTLLAKMAVFEKLPYVDPLLGKDKRNEILKSNYFTKDDFTDTLLLHTDLIPTKVIRYLSFYKNENLAPEAQEAEFIKAVDIILKKAGSSENIYNSVIDYLIEGFEKFDMEMTLLHIYDNYVAGGSCLDEKKAQSLKDKTEAIKKLGKGQPAPDFTFTDSQNNTHKLYDFQSQYTLVIFWASWCNHCQKVIPEVKVLYDNTDRNKLEVIAISLDKEEKPWKDYIEQNKLTWYNYSNLKGWDCPIGRSYYVYATPTMFLLDKDKKIVAKPLNVRDLRMSLQ